MITPMLGYISGISKNIKLSTSALNQHILITGKSGSGKTVALKKIEEGIVLQGGRVLVLNFNGTHDSLKEQGDVNFINACEDGIPLSLFSPVIRPNGSEEEIDDICESVVDVFSNLGKLGNSQKRILSKACYKAVENRRFYDNDMDCLNAFLEEGNDEVSQGVIDKFWNIFRKGKFVGDGTLWRKGAITVIDFSEFNISSQMLLAEMVMAILWRQHRINGQQEDEPVWIVCDEFQSMNLKEGSVLTQILREGRKFNLSILLATQTLSSFDTGCRAIMQQAGTKLYFLPAESDVRKISKDIPGIPQDKVQQFLHGLRVGECLATGEFQIGAKNVEKVLKLSFR
jgi:Cdc6-like AAA superfamily ATPase